jgi:uncharacterized RDD family membrane protein YckC
MSAYSNEQAIDDAPLLEGVLFRRVWAWLIDLLLVGGIVAVLWVVLVGFGLLTLGLGLPLLGLLPIVPLAYHILFVAGERSATPGQAMMDLAVRRDQDLGRPSLLQAILFTAGLWLTLGAGVVWLAAALLTTRHRTLHDLVSGVVVVRARVLDGTLTAPANFGNMRRGSGYA